MDKYKNVFRTQGLLDLKKCLGSIEEKPKKKGNLRVVAQVYNREGENIYKCKECGLAERRNVKKKIYTLDEYKNGKRDPFVFECETCGNQWFVNPSDYFIGENEDIRLNLDEDFPFPFQEDDYQREDIWGDKIAKMISHYQKVAQLEDRGEFQDPDYMDDYDLPEYEPDLEPDLEDDDFSDLQLDEAINPGYEPVGMDEDPFVDDEFGPEYDEYLERSKKPHYFDEEDIDADYFSEGPDENLEDEEYLESADNFKEIMDKYINR